MHEPCCYCGLDVDCMALVNKIGYVYYPTDILVVAQHNPELRILCPTAFIAPTCVDCLTPGMMTTQRGYSKYYLAAPIPEEFPLCFWDIPVRIEVTPMTATRRLVRLDAPLEPPVPTPAVKGVRYPCHCNHCH